MHSKAIVCLVPRIVLPAQGPLTTVPLAHPESICSTMGALLLVQVQRTPTTPSAVCAILVVPPAIQLAVYHAI